MRTNRCRSRGPCALAAALMAGPLGGAAHAAGEGLLTLTVIDEQDPRAGRLPHAPGRAGQEAAEGRPVPLLARPFRLSRQDHAEAAAGQVYLRVAARAGISTPSDGNFTIDAFRRRLEGGDPAAVRRHGGRRLVVAATCTCGGRSATPNCSCRPTICTSAEFVTWWNDKSDSEPNASCRRSRWSRFDGKPLLPDSMAGGFSPRGHRAALLQSAGPAVASRRRSAEYPSGDEVSARRRAKSADAWVDLTAPYWWDLPMLVALGQVDSIEVANSHFCRHAADRRTKATASRATASSTRAPSATPAGRRTSISSCWNAGCGFRPAPAAARA